MSFKNLIKLVEDEETLERMNKRIKELIELIKESRKEDD